MNPNRRIRIVSRIVLCALVAGIGILISTQLISWYLVGRASLAENLLSGFVSEIKETLNDDVEDENRPTYLFVCPEVWAQFEPHQRSSLENSVGALEMELISSGDLTPEATFQRKGALAVMVCFRTLNRGPFLRKVEILSGFGPKIGYGYSKSEVRLFVLGRWIKTRPTDEKFIL